MSTPPAWLEKLRRQAPWIAPLGESLAQLGRPLLFTSLALTGLTLGMRQLGWLEFVELAAYDHFIQRQPDEGADPRFLVVGITETDLQTLQQWPISDLTLAQALEAIEAHQPKVVAIDVFRDIPVEPGRAELLQQLQQNDHTLIVCKASSAADLGTPPPPELTADQVGFADLVVDPGGILRRNLMMLSPIQPTIPFPKNHLCNDPNTTLLSLSFHAALLYLQSQGIQPEMTEAGTLQLGAAEISPLGPHIGGYRGADAGGFQVLLRYRSENQAVAQVSLMEVLTGNVAPELIRDRIVMIGYTSPQAKDDFYTPFSASRDDTQKMPGVVVHAQAASQLISAALDQRSLIRVWPKPVEILWITGWSLVGGMLAWYLRHPARFALMLLVGGGTLYGVGLLLFFDGLWMPVVPPLFNFIGTAVGIVLLDRFNNSTYGQTVYRKVKTFLKLEIEIDEDKLEKQVTEITESDYFRELQDTVKTLRESTSAGDASPSQAELIQSGPVESWHHERSGQGNLSHLLDDVLNQDTTANRAASPAPVDKTAEAAEADYLAEIKQATQQLKQVHSPTHSPTPDPPSDPEGDYLQRLQQKTQQLKQGPIDFPPEPTAPPEEDDGLGYLQQIRQTAQQIKQDGSAPPAPEADTSSYLDWLQEAAQPIRPTPSDLSKNFRPFVLDDPFCDYRDISEATAHYVAFIDQEISALKEQIQRNQQSEKLDSERAARQR